MKKLFLLCVIFLLIFSIFVSGQVQAPSDVLIFEQFVVKEHFVTKQEIKEYIDQKAVEYQKTTEAQLIGSFEEIENIIESKITKFIIKLLAGIFGVVVFSGSFWYFLKVKLDIRYAKIKELKNQPKPKKEAPAGVVTFKDDKPPEPEKTMEDDSLQKFKDDLVAEAEEIKNG